jgi:hypothetical protein
LIEKLSGRVSTIAPLSSYPPHCINPAIRA